LAGAISIDPPGHVNDIDADPYSRECIGSINTHLTIPLDNEQKIATPRGSGAFEICLLLFWTLSLGSYQWLHPIFLAI